MAAQATDHDAHEVLLRAALELASDPDHDPAGLDAITDQADDPEAMARIKAALDEDDDGA